WEVGESSKARVKNGNRPTTGSTRKRSDVGTGWRMDQAEMFRRFMFYGLLRDYRDDVAVFQEAGTTGDDFFTLFQPGRDFDQVAAACPNFDLTRFGAVALEHEHERSVVTRQDCLRRDSQGGVVGEID